MWSGDLLIADWDDLVKNIASEVHVKRLKSEEVQVTTVQGKCVTPCADGPLKQEGHVVSRHLRFDNFKNKTMTREATLTRRISGDYVYRHHVAPRGQLCVPQEPNGPIPLKQGHCRRPANKDKVGHLGGERHRRLLERREGHGTVSDDWSDSHDSQIHQQTTHGKKATDRSPANIEV